MSKRGLDYKLYVNTDDPYDDTPTWVEDTNVRDATRTLSKVMADVSRRVTNRRLQIGTMIEVEYGFQKVDEEDDSLLDQYEDSFWDGTKVEVAILDGPIDTDGSKGIRMMVEVSNFTVNEALEDAGLIDVSIVPRFHTGNLPRRVIVASGTLTDV